MRADSPVPDRRRAIMTTRLPWLQRTGWCLVGCATILVACYGSGGEASDELLTVGEDRRLEGRVVAIDATPMFVDGDGEITLQTDHHGRVLIRIPARERLCQARGLGAFSTIVAGDSVRVLGRVTRPGEVTVCAAESHLLAVEEAASVNEERFVAAAGAVIEFLRGRAEFDALNLSDTVTFYMAPEGGGGTEKVPAADLRERTAWRIRGGGGQAHALVPPEGMSRLETRFGRHMKCFEYALADEFPELARHPHVGTRLEPADMTSCLQSWNLTLVFQAETLPPRLTAVVYDQWEW